MDGATRDDIFSAFGSRYDGLTTDEASAKLLRNGRNTLPIVSKKHWSSKFFAQFTHFFALLLWAAAFISFGVAILDPSANMLPIAVAILIVIFLNGIFGFYQEFRTEKSLEELRRILPLMATVRRDGAVRTISAEELVSGDIVFLKEGDKIPADIYVLDASELFVNESSLTGESDFVSVGAIGGGHHKTSVYSGTFVVKGEATGMVFATGKDSKYGVIAALTQSVSPGIGHLQLEINRISKVVALVSFLIAASFIVISGVGGNDLWKTFLFSLGVLVALIPEGLLPTVTLSLAFGAKRMAKKGFLVNGLSVIENLGAITVIATDKTGTLTKNTMTVANWYESQKADVPSGRLLEACILCNRADDNGGDPVEYALFRFAAVFCDPVIVRKQTPMVTEYSFDYHLKRMTTVHKTDANFLVVCKGAPEVVLSLCDRLNGDKLDADKKQTLIDTHDAMAKNGFRIIAFATNIFDRQPSNRQECESAMDFVGFVALVDPLREDVKEAIVQCKKAGIRLLMLTGDHPVTAGAIGVDAGIISSPMEVTVGDRLADMPKAALRHMLRKNHVFARVTPEQKLLIVSTLKEMNEVVAVTGDGVNDAPALKMADVGIAMGSGTDVAKQSAAAILIDDHFATIVRGIEEGRTVYENIRRFITYMLASNLPEAVPYVLFFWIGVPLALPVPLVLAIDLGTDIMPGLALGAEPPHGILMNKKPHGIKEPILTPSVYLRAFGYLGVITSVLSMGVFFCYLYLHGWRGENMDFGDPLYMRAATITFAAVVFAQIGNGLSCRSEKDSIFKIGFLSNRYYWMSVGIELAILASIIWLPGISDVFGTMPFEPMCWLAVISVMPIVFAMEELRKVLMYKKAPIF